MTIKLKLDTKLRCDNLTSGINLKNSILLNNSTVDRYLVIGTMSSGKSTFLNGLIGVELFPSRNEACTAKTISYYANPSMNEFLYKNKKHKKPILRKNLDYKQIEKWNESVNTDEIVIEGPLRTGKRKSFGVIDTPGPNNSMDKSHSEIMKNAINNTNYKRVFYILNATQLGTEDDYFLLNYVKQNCPRAKLVFVVNKADSIDDTEDENLNNVSKNVESYLVKNGFRTPKIYFVSSLSALLALKVTNNYELTKKESKDYKRLSIILEENLAIHNINAIKKKSSKQKIENELWNNSGIPELLNIL